MNEPGDLDGMQRRLDEMAERHARELGALRQDLKKMMAAAKAMETDDATRPARPISEAPTPATPPPLPKAAERFRRSLLQNFAEDPAPVVNPAPTEAPSPAPEPATPSRPPAPPAEAEADADAAGEIDFGRVWFVRIGVVILLTGLVFLGNYAYQNWIRELSNGARLAGLLLVAGVWVELGRRLSLRLHLMRFGEVVMAGGLGFTYYCVYAAHHVERLRVIAHAPVAGVLLAAAGVGIAAVAWRRNSRIMATMGMALAAYTTVVQPMGWLACVSSGTLACMGVFFLTRRGWSTPGWVAMVGMYASFLLWQVLGAAGSGGDRLATLWFLVPMWLVFAVAGIAPAAGASLDARMRAWFVGINNGFFFLLFHGLWEMQYGRDQLWLVAAVFAGLLIAFGVVGRRTLPVAGAANLGQGLLLLGYALILKLDGYHLALAFATEAVVLAVAYRKFGGRVEAVFSVLAAVAAAGWICLADDEPPLWSAWLAVVLIGAAYPVMRFALVGETHREFRRIVRGGAGVIFWSAWAAWVVGVLLRMEADFSHALAAVFALAIGVAVRIFDGKRRMPELGWGGVGLLSVALLMLAYGALESGFAWWVPALAVVPHLAGAWWWRAELEVWTAPVRNPHQDPRIFGWLHAVLAVVAVWAACAHAGWPNDDQLLLTVGCALGLALAAIGMQTGRIAALSGLLALVALLVAWVGETRVHALEARTFFWVAGISVAVLPAWFVGSVGERIPLGGRLAGGALFRAAAFLAWAVGVHRAMDSHAIDGWAATAIVMVGVAIWLRVRVAVEAWIFLAIAMAGLMAHMLDSPWEQVAAQPGWRGVMVIAGLLTVVFTHRWRVPWITDEAQRLQVMTALAIASCAVTTLWATQMLVWRTGWDGTVALWSVLALLSVSAGLWQPMRGLRLAGLGLLVLALVKLFAHDVWDYTAFTRVVSFIALGLALILLGLFYNHFAATLRKWL